MELIRTLQKSKFWWVKVGFRAQPESLKDPKNMKLPQIGLKEKAHFRRDPEVAV